MRCAQRFVAFPAFRSVSVYVARGSPVAPLLLTEAHQLARDTAELATRAAKVAGVATNCALELMMPKKSGK